MAKQVVENLIDDIDGSPATVTVVFGVDGQLWSLDLNDEHSDALRAVFDPFVAVARRVRPEGRPGRRTVRIVGDKQRNTAIREWALSEGVELPGRGRIANGVQEAFDAKDADALYAAAGLERADEEPPSQGRRKVETRFSG